MPDKIWPAAYNPVCPFANITNDRLKGDVAVNDSKEATGMTDELASYGATVADHACQQQRFNRLSAEWKKDTFLLSKISAKVLHISYQKIIGMGAAAVPFILKDLKDNGPNHWFWALHAITEENPVPKNMTGNIAAMAEAWLLWGNKKGYLKDYQQITS
jgi:hypothetical protein